MHRITEAEERTSELEGRMMEIAAMELQKMRYSGASCSVPTANFFLTRMLKK